MRGAFKLAKTKFKLRKVMTWTVVIIASVLFMGLIAGVTMFAGLNRSLEKITENTFNDEYLLKVAPRNTQVILSNYDISIETVREIREFEKKYYEDLEQRYVSLGLEYNKKSETSMLIPAAYKSYDLTLPVELQVEYDRSAPTMLAYEKKKTEELLEKSQNKLEDLEKILDRYGASKYGIIDDIKMKGRPNARLIQEEKEDFGVTEEKSGQGYPLRYAIYNSKYVIASDKLLEPYLNQKEATQGIPVVVSFQEAAQLFGKEMGILEDSPSGLDEKNAWFQMIREKLIGKTYEVCYRNETENEKLNKIQRDFVEIRLHQGQEGYEEPKLQYDYPKEKCGEVVVKKDTRSAEEKKVEEDQIERQKKLGEYEEPRRELLTFQIVGFINVQEKINDPNNLEKYLKKIFTKEDFYYAVIPMQMYQSLPEHLKFEDLISRIDTNKEPEYITRVVKFNDTDKLNQFMKEEMCGEETSYNDPCGGRQFNASRHGINHLVMGDLNKVFLSILAVTIPVIFGVAMVIIWVVVARVIAESRKESAIYRAMGAKRSDIVKIYMTYVMMLALRIALIALAVGVMVAKLIDVFYGAELTGLVQSILGVASEDIRVSLFEISPLVGLVVLAIFVICLLAAVVPIIGNTLRQPIRDMKEE